MLSGNCPLIYLCIKYLIDVCRDQLIFTVLSLRIVGLNGRYSEIV